MTRQVAPRKFNPEAVTWTMTVWHEDEDPADHFDLGDEEKTIEVVNEIREASEGGAGRPPNIWAWCRVRVTASWAGFEGHGGPIGCVSEESEATWRESSGYYQDLCDEALANLMAEIENAGWFDVLDVRPDDLNVAVQRGIQVAETVYGD